MKTLGRGRNWTDVKDHHGDVVRLMTIKPTKTTTHAKAGQS